VNPPLSVSYIDIIDGEEPRPAAPSIARHSPTIAENYALEDQFREAATSETGNERSLDATSFIAGNSSRRRSSSAISCGARALLREARYTAT